MKWMFLLFLALPAVTATAQNTTKRYEYINTVTEKIPTHAGSAYYDSSVSLDEKYTKEVLEANSAYFFADVLGSDLVKKSGKHTTTAAGTYSFSITNRNIDEDMYVVNYWLDVTVKDAKFDVNMHDFSIVHNGHDVDFAGRMAAARKNDGVSKQILAIFHSNNSDIMTKACAAMKRTGAGTQPTAKK